jgi:WD40 repeat protein
LAYCEAYQYIISGSYDHDVILWSPLVPVMLYKLRGHSLPIVSIRYVPDSPQLLTASMDGLIKVWDLRNLTCVQSITADVGEGSGGNNLNCVEVCPARKQFLCGSQRFLLYKQVETAGLVWLRSVW